MQGKWVIEIGGRIPRIEVIGDIWHLCEEAKAHPGL